MAAAQRTALAIIAAGISFLKELTIDVDTAFDVVLHMSLYAS
ncbi:MAG TPA: hypothetical protein VK487_04440 [Candidatus Bathyarchaeia archaeon]|nr:hypothetical protein [Candidatus Bathyarchaeia archaeon]